MPAPLVIVNIRFRSTIMALIDRCTMNIEQITKSLTADEYTLLMKKLINPMVNLSISMIKKLRSSRHGHNARF